MIIYNVTIKVHPEIIQDWQNWMNNEHIPEMMALNLFQKNVFCKLLEQDDSDGATFVIQYFCENINKYKQYIEEHSTKMREKGVEKFGDKMIGFRTIMETIEI